MLGGDENITVMVIRTTEDLSQKVAKGCWQITEPQHLSTELVQRLTQIGMPIGPAFDIALNVGNGVTVYARKISKNDKR